MTNSWLCYILKSVDSNRTYVGATDNLYRRLCDHNGLHGKSKGAKATKGQMWYPFMCITGFPNKIACLSFESGVRRIKRRKCKHIYGYNKYASSIDKRVIDVYNLLHVGSPLKKWTNVGLTVNWLEPDCKIDGLVLPDETYDLTNLFQMDI